MWTLRFRGICKRSYVEKPKLRPVAFQFHSQLPLPFSRAGCPRCRSQRTTWSLGMGHVNPSSHGSMFCSLQGHSASKNWDIVLVISASWNIFKCGNTRFPLSQKAIFLWAHKAKFPRGDVSQTSPGFVLLVRVCWSLLAAVGQHGVEVERETWEVEHHNVVTGASFSAELPHV